jgi:tRNA dimethylallyltransferase
LAPIKHKAILEHDPEKWKPVFVKITLENQPHSKCGRQDAVFRILIRTKAQYVKVVSEPEIILIAGPTASGKSALALALAEKLRGVIVNADSMQVYRDLRVITARPTPKEEARVPHRLYGRIDAAENYSVGRWRTDAAATIDATKRYGRAAIVVGGTGLYFNALIRGLAAVPPIPDEIREQVRARLESEGINKLHTELMQRDPAAAARLMPGDRARITRALEVVLATGRSLLAWHEEGNAASLDAARAAKIFLSPDRDALMQRIDARFDEMVASGAIEEVQALAARDLDPNLPAMKAHGVPWLIRHLRGEISLEEAAEGAKRDTRQYTKRQATWFRNQLPEFAWVEPDKALAAVEEPGGATCELIRRHEHGAAAKTLASWDLKDRQLDRCKSILKVTLARAAAYDIHSSRCLRCHCQQRERCSRRRQRPGSRGSNSRHRIESRAHVQEPRCRGHRLRFQHPHARNGEHAHPPVPDPFEGAGRRHGAEGLVHMHDRAGRGRVDGGRCSRGCDARVCRIDPLGRHHIGRVHVCPSTARTDAARD